MSFESRALRLEREHGRAGADDITVTIAADFLRGGEPTFARTFDRRGALLGAIQRLQDEPWATFKARVVVEAGQLAPPPLRQAGKPEMGAWGVGPRRNKTAA